MSQASAKSESGTGADDAPNPRPDAGTRPSSSAGGGTLAMSGARRAKTSRSDLTTRARSARTSADDPARDGVRLGVIAFTTAASFLGLLALGAIAGRVGADTWIGAGPLERSLAETFVTGIRLPLAMLRALYASGVDDPLFFAASMALLIPPIAALAAARPARPGGPRPSTPVVHAARLGAALIIAAAIGVAVRLSATARPTMADAISGEPWLDRVLALAASDAIAMAFAVLLAVLVFRLPLDRWVRVLAGTIAIGTAIAATVAAAASSGIADDVERMHPIVRSESNGAVTERLLIGRTAEDAWVLLTSGPPPTVVIEPHGPATIAGRRSIAGVLRDSE